MDVVQQFLGPLGWVIPLLLFVLAAAIILMPLFLRGRDQEFFRINYITWYLLRSSIAGLSIIAIVTLGLTGVLSGEVISALLGSLLGYVLGSTSRSDRTDGTGLAHRPPTSTPSVAEPSSLGSSPAEQSSANVVASTLPTASPPNSSSPPPTTQPPNP